MGKLSCKVCGTVYSDSASNCPICGSGRDDSVVVNAAEAPVAIAEKKAAKGGHYTKSSVRKRNKAANANPKKAAPKTAEEPQEKKKSGALFAVLLVLLILLAVCIAAYIGMEYALPFLQSQKKPGTTQQTLPPETTAGTVETEEPSASEMDDDILCTGLSIEKNQYTLTVKGEGFTINAVPTPFNTTQEITYASSNPDVATVDANGNVKAVGSGEADIVISCGVVQNKCHVKCTLSEDSTAPTETEPEETIADNDLVLNREDFTMFFKGDTFQLEAEGIEGKEIVWKSNNSNVASVSDTGLVKALRKGETTITATYKGVTASCIVRCSFPEDYEDYSGSENESSGGNTGSDTPADYIISHIDVTIYVGGSFELDLMDRNGNSVDVSWISNNSSVASVSGNEVTGVSGGTTTIFCNYEGKTYQCIVRVYYEP